MTFNSKRHKNEVFTCIIFPWDIAVGFAENSQFEAAIGGRTYRQCAFWRSLTFRSVRNMRFIDDENEANEKFREISFNPHFRHKSHYSLHVEELLFHTSILIKPNDFNAAKVSF